MQAETILSALRADGVYVTCGEELWPNQVAARQELARQSKQYASDFFTNSQPFSKGFLLKRKRSAHMPHDPLIVLAQPLSQVASAYFNEPAKLFRADVHLTRPVGKAQRRFSQDWHRDDESDVFFKVLWFVSDITETNGPFEYVRGTQRGQHTEWCPKHGYPNALGKALLKPIPKDRVLSVTGPPDTVVIVDTSGIHRGGYATLDERIHVMWTWIPQSSKYASTVTVSDVA